MWPSRTHEGCVFALASSFVDLSHEDCSRVGNPEAWQPPRASQGDLADGESPQAIPLPEDRFQSRRRSQVCQSRVGGAVDTVDFTWGEICMRHWEAPAESQNQTIELAQEFGEPSKGLLRRATQLVHCCHEQMTGGNSAQSDCDAALSPKRARTSKHSVIFMRTAAMSLHWLWGEEPRRSWSTKTGTWPTTRRCSWPEDRTGELACPRFDRKGPSCTRNRRTRSTCAPSPSAVGPSDPKTPVGSSGFGISAPAAPRLVGPLT